MKFNKLFVILAITMITMATMIRIRRSETDTEADRKKKSTRALPADCYTNGDGTGDLLTAEVFEAAHKNDKNNTKKVFATYCVEQAETPAAANTNTNGGNNDNSPQGKKKKF
jgi:hypothetical protein